MKYYHVMLLAVTGLLMTGCNNNAPDELKPVHKQILTGKVQKGPFVEGTSIYIFSLGENFAQTGTTCKTTIVDKTGTFEQRDMQLSSQFVELEATGYYYNEVKNELSTSPLTLNAIADITSADHVNVNILTTLERERILYLTSGGQNFRNARRQAHEEVLAVFGMTTNQVGEAVDLELGADPQLLVISALVQGVRPTADITRLISLIASDIREDGELDNPEAQAMLKNNSMSLNAARLVANMAAYEISYSYSVQDVEALLQQFNTNTAYNQTEFVEYPAESEYGRNILAGGTFHTGERVSFAALTPAWCPLKVEVRGQQEWQYELMPDGPKNWKAGAYTSENGYHTQTFTVIKSGEESLLKFYTPSQPDSLHILFYENSDTPTREIRVAVEN